MSIAAPVAPTTLTIDGVEHPVADFSDAIKHLVNVHTAWRGDLQEQRLALAKTEAALRSLDVELSQAVATELAAKNAPPTEERPVAEPVDE